ncbi:MAG: DUF2490 domain-containing protein [Crocinitomicaceae bacterium]|nr:DUF2490 domain-containing protein [Crocinitomicaceae bacterium]
MNWIKIICVVFSISFSSALFGQESEVTISNDFWTGASLKYKLNKKIAFSVDQQVRMTDNLNRIRSTFFEFGASYKFNKHFSTRAQYRYTMPNQQRHVNRLTLDGTVKWKIKPTKFELSYRFRFQHGVVTFTKEPETYIRNRFQIKYKVWKKMKLFARYESFYRLNDKMRFRRNLCAGGIEFELNKKLDLSFFYRMDQKINTKNPERRNIIAVLASFAI